MPPRPQTTPRAPRQRPPGSSAKTIKSFIWRCFSLRTEGEGVSVPFRSGFGRALTSREKFKVKIWSIRNYKEFRKTTISNWRRARRRQLARGQPSKVAVDQRVE